MPKPGVVGVNILRDPEELPRSLTVTFLEQLGTAIKDLVGGVKRTRGDLVSISSGIFLERFQSCLHERRLDVHVNLQFLHAAAKGLDGLRLSLDLIDRGLQLFFAPLASSPRARTLVPFALLASSRRSRHVILSTHHGAVSSRVQQWDRAGCRSAVDPCHLIGKLRGNQGGGCRKDPVAESDRKSAAEERCYSDRREHERRGIEVISFRIRTRPELRLHLRAIGA